MPVECLNMTESIANGGSVRKVLTLGQVRGIYGLSLHTGSFNVACQVTLYESDPNPTVTDLKMVFAVYGQYKCRDVNPFFYRLNPKKEYRLYFYNNSGSTVGIQTTIWVER